LQRTEDVNAEWTRTRPPPADIRRLLELDPLRPVPTIPPQVPLQRQTPSHVCRSAR
jgi:hypothetical protein